VYVPEKKNSFANITVDDDSYNIEASIFYILCTR